MSEKNTLDDKIKKLDEKVEWFYSDDFKIEEATKKYKEAITLAKEVQRGLDELKNEIEVLKEDFSK